VPGVISRWKIGAEIKKNEYRHFMNGLPQRNWARKSPEGTAREKRERERWKGTLTKDGENLTDYVEKKIIRAESRARKTSRVRSHH